MTPRDKKKTILRVSLPLITVVLLLFLPSSIVTPVMGYVESVALQREQSRFLGD